jgi:RNA polymerase sigma-70 factor (ECF subfamily)
MPTQDGLLGGPKRISVPILKKRPDAELVEALGAHAGLMLRTAARITGSLAEAQDVAQDLAEKLLRKPPRDVRSWPALLKTMTVNASIDRTRRRREVGEAAEPVSLEGPEKALEQEEQAAALRRALDRLSERDAQLFSFYYFADLSHADIGRQLDMKPNAVAVALHRVRSRLGDLIHEEGHINQILGASS